MEGIGFLFGLLLLQSGITIDWDGSERAQTGQILFRSCLAFEPGELGGGAALVLRDSAGNDLVADFIPTAFWKDGSIRILALRASIPATRNDGTFRLVPHRTPRPRAKSLSVRRDGRSVRVDTGSMVLVVDGNEPGFVSGVTWRGKEIETLGRGVGLAARIDGLLFEPRQSLVGVDGGRALTRIRLTGRLVGPSAEIGPEYTLCLHLLAGSGAIGCSVRLVGGEFEGLCSGVSIAIEPPWCRGAAPCVIRTGRERIEKTMGPSESLTVRALPSRMEMSCGEEETVLPGKSGLRLILKGCTPDLALSVPGFGRLHPWSVTVVQGGGLTLSLLNEHFRWDPYFSFERRIALGLISPGRSGDAAICPFRAIDAFGQARDPRRRSLVFARAAVSRGNDPLAALFLEVAETLQKRLLREWARWDGFMDHGDYRKSYGIWANQEYDPAFGLIKKFLLTNRCADLEMARCALDHWLLFDRAGPDDPSASEGTPWIHGRNHRSGRFEAGHMWLDGLLAYYLLTGEPEHRDAAMSVGASLVAALRRLEKTKLERNLAWALVGLSALSDAGFDRFETAMDRAAMLIRSRQLKCGLFAFGEKRFEEEDCHAVNTWVTAGITVEGLYRHYRVTGDTRSLGAAVRAMRALLRSGRDRGSGIVFQTLLVSRTEEEVIAREGRVTGGKAALFGAGAARAFELSGEEVFRSCARSAIEKALVELRSHVPDFVGEDLALILRSGPDVLAATSAR